MQKTLETLKNNDTGNEKLNLRDGRFVAEGYGAPKAFINPRIASIFQDEIPTLPPPPYVEKVKARWLRGRKVAEETSFYDNGLPYQNFRC